MTNKFTVILKRIIAVNSAKFAYAEIPLNDNLVVFGTGNLGKSSLVNAVRFFLLPDVNLKNSDLKFGFASGKGESSPYFTKDEIYDHYFVTDDSRLILEVEHLLIDGSKQVHCQIISRGGDYGLKRFFIPEPYSEIEHLFWDKTIGEAGGRPKNPPGNKLLAELNKINSKTKHYAQVEQLTNALYMAEIMRPESSPFVIFPLRDTKPSSVDSLRALVKMLFNQDERSLRLLTATSIELRDQADSNLSLDVDSIISEQHDLKRRREILELFRSHEPKFHQLKAEFDTFLKQEQAQIEFSTLINSMMAYRDVVNGQLIDLTTRLKTIGAEKNIADELYKDNQINIAHERRSILEKEKEIKVLTDKIKKSQTIFSSYFGMKKYEVLDVLKDELKNKRDYLDALRDESHRARILPQRKKELEDRESELLRINDRLSNSEYNLKNQLDDHTLNVLSSINRELTSANPGRLLTQLEIEALSGFARLFRVEAGYIHYFDHKFQFFTPVKEDYIDLINNLNSEISNLKREIKNLSVVAKDPYTIQKDIDKTSKEIASLEIDIVDLDELEFNEKTVNKLNEEILSRQKAEASLTAEEAALKLKCDGYLEVLGSINIQSEKIKNLYSEIDDLIRAYNLTGRFPFLSELRYKVQPQPDFIYDSFCGARLKELAFQLERIRQSKSAIRESLISMIHLRLIDDEFLLLEGNSDDSSIIATVNSISRKYELLNDDFDLHSRAVETHNKNLKNRLERLSKTKVQIENFVKQINEELSDAVINDLEAVRLTVTLNSFFDDLVKSWQEYDDLGSSDTLPDEWYARLKIFLESDAVNQTDKILRMENVIKSVGYETKKLNETWDSKAQSTSTLMLINTRLCELFIRRLSDNDNSSIQFPVIMDEIGKVSSEQFPILISDLNSRGIKLIGVTVHGKSGDVTVPFSNLLYMDELLTSEPYLANLRHACFSKDIETIKPKISEQNSLFGGDD